ncbi:hypothetical protein FBU30_009500 [Linnemannia zychae]|nr:hypothetical protein FBU30_009500 [Linnemannia zychae]
MPSSNSRTKACSQTGAATNPKLHAQHSPPSVAAATISASSRTISSKAITTAASASWRRVFLMPELAYLIHCFLGSSHLAVASLVCQTWHQLWTPFLWEHLVLPRPRPASTSLQRVNNSSGVRVLHTSLTNNHHKDEFAYPLSSECLDRFGNFVMRLDAARLTMPELLRISNYCSQLRVLQLTDCLLPTKVLSPLLQPLTQLSRLTLNIPIKDYWMDEDDENKEARTEALIEHRKQDETIRGRIFHRDELGENEILKTIELYASSTTLEYLELTFQSSVRISVKAICSLLRRQRSLRTLKLIDVDIEDIQPRRSKRKGAKRDYRVRRTLDGGNDQSNSYYHSNDANVALEVSSRSITSSGISSGSSSSVTSPSLSSPSPLISDNDDDSSNRRIDSPTEWNRQESFRLRFFSISSSHTSDSSLTYILERCPHLRILHLHSCDTITDQSLQTIVRHCPQLESISLSSCKRCTTSGLDQFFSDTVSLLRHVHLCDLAALHDETLEILAHRHGKSLLKLAVYFCGLVTDRGVKALLTTCSQLRVFGLHAYGLTPTIFEQPWASCKTLEQLDLQGVFRVQPNDPITAASNFSATTRWQDQKARIDGFMLTKSRLLTLERLRNLRLAAGGIGKEVLGGFSALQQIEVLHLYGLQSTQFDSLPWGDIKKYYPFLRQIYCDVMGVVNKGLRHELIQMNIELLSSSSIPDLAFENNFDD